MTFTSFPKKILHENVVTKKPICIWTQFHDTIATFSHVALRSVHYSQSVKSYMKEDNANDHIAPHYKIFRPAVAQVRNMQFLFNGKKIYLEA